MGGCRYYTTVREEVVEENVVLGLQGVPKTMKLIHNSTIIFSVSIHFFFKIILNSSNFMTFLGHPVPLVKLLLLWVLWSSFLLYSLALLVVPISLMIVLGATFFLGFVYRSWSALGTPIQLVLFIQHCYSLSEQPCNIQLYSCSKGGNFAALLLLLLLVN